MLSQKIRKMKKLHERAQEYKIIRWSLKPDMDTMDAAGKLISRTTM